MDWDICLQEAGPAFPVTLSQEEGTGSGVKAAHFLPQTLWKREILPGALLGLFSGQRDGWVDTEG